MKFKSNVFFLVAVFGFLGGCAKSVQWSFENVSYGAHEKQTFNILFPQDEHNGHVIVYLHGGFYYSGNKLWYPLFLTEFSENSIFVTMDYRLISRDDNTVHVNDIIADVDLALMKITEVSNES